MLRARPYVPNTPRLSGEFWKATRAFSASDLTPASWDSYSSLQRASNRITSWKAETFNSIVLLCWHVEVREGGTLIKVLRIEWWTHRFHWNITMVPTDPSSMVMVTWLCLGLCQPLIVDRNPCYFLSLQASLTAEPTSVSSVWLQLTALFRSSHLPRSHFAASKEGTSGPLTIFKKHPQLLIDKVLKAKHSSSWSWASTLFGFIPTTVLL